MRAHMRKEVHLSFLGFFTQRNFILVMSLRLLYPSDGKFLFLLACFLSFNHTENDTWYDDEDDNDNNIFFLEYFLWWPVLQQH